MSTVKKIVARKAAKAAVKHTTHGVVAKAQRKPLRSTTLLAVGGVLGAVLTWLVAKQS